ncbi:hypothetical protein RB213_003186, partial [Colletotrichum asianum]
GKANQGKARSGNRQSTSISVSGPRHDIEHAADSPIASSRGILVSAPAIIGLTLVLLLLLLFFFTFSPSDLCGHSSSYTFLLAPPAKI